MSSPSLWELERTTKKRPPSPMRELILLVLVDVIGWAEIRSGYSEATIVGGFVVKDISRSPYVVSIQTQIGTNVWRQHCGGCLLSALYVLTACHCVAELHTRNGQIQLMPTPFNQWFFIAGALNVSHESWESNPEAQHRNPKYIHYHPECELRQNQWLSSEVTVKDASIAKMSTPFNLNHRVQPAELVTFTPTVYRHTVSTYFGKKCTIVGWGLAEPVSVLDDIVTISTTTEQDDPEGPTSEPPYNDDLFNLSLNLGNDQECWEKMIDALQKETHDEFPTEDFERRLKENLKDQVCGVAKSESLCDGDWGSPMICEERVIVGVTSWGIGCGNPVPTVIQSLPEIIKWVEQELCTFSTCEDVQHAHVLCERPEDLVKKCSLTTIKPSRLSTESMIRQLNSTEPIISPYWVTVLASYLAIKNSRTF